MREDLSFLLLAMTLSFTSQGEISSSRLVSPDLSDLLLMMLPLTNLSRVRSMRCITDIVRKRARNRLPLRKIASHGDGRLRHDLRQGRRAFVPPNSRRQLIIIRITMPALHRLDIPTVFVIKLIDKHDRFANASEFIMATGNPFIPPGDKKGARIFAQRMLELLGKIQPEGSGSWPLVARPAVKTPAPGAGGFTHRPQPPSDRILPDSNGHLFFLPTGIKKGMLRKNLEPTPHVRPLRAAEIIRLRRTKRKEVAE